MEAQNEVRELLGTKLVKPDNSDVDVSTWLGAFQGKATYIGLYYGAHWAPPSRLYTTNLQEKFYKLMKESADHKDLMEVIFVSDDREVNHFKRNIAKMPWMSIPFDAELVKQSLKSKFNVAELPTFAIINAKTGKLIKLDARQDIFQGLKAFDTWAKDTENAAA